MGWNEKEHDEILEGFARSEDVADWRKEDVARKARMTIPKGGLGCSDPQEGLLARSCEPRNTPQEGSGSMPCRQGTETGRYKVSFGTSSSSKRLGS